MRNLLNFILKSSSWLLAILLVAISFYLVFSHNSYQRSVYLTSANGVVGWFYEKSNNLTSFFHLQKNNRELMERNAMLENQLSQLRAIVMADSTNKETPEKAFLNDSTSNAYISQFSFIPAEVVNMSVMGASNFITINKGNRDGIKPDMGVISKSGIVGVVLTVSENFSVIIPIINTKFRLSARLNHSENTGSVSWNSEDTEVAQLGELPKHEVYEKGDTVLTSFSRIFPKDIVIGFVEKRILSKDDNFITLDFKIASNFHALQDVMVINDSYYKEQKELENSVMQ